MSTMARTLGAGLSDGLSSWARNSRGSVSVEFVLGAVVILTVAVGGLDLYRIIDARFVTLHAATTMADYVSLEETPREAFIEDLAKFSYRNEIGLPSEAAFVVSAVTRPEATGSDPDPAAVVRWQRRIAVHEDPLAPPSPLVDACGHLDGPGNGDWAQRTLEMEPGEMVVVVEVCVKLLPRAFVSGGLLPDSVFPTLFYQHRIFPVRGDKAPEEPS